MLVLVTPMADMYLYFYWFAGNPLRKFNSFKLVWGLYRRNDFKERKLLYWGQTNLKDSNIPLSRATEDAAGTNHRMVRKNRPKSSHKNSNFRGGQAQKAHNPPQPGMQPCFHMKKARSLPSYQPQQDAVKSGMSWVHAALLHFSERSELPLTGLFTLLFLEMLTFRRKLGHSFLA